MNGWCIAATVAGGWSVVSVLTGVVLGHAIAGKPLRSPSGERAFAVPAAVLDMAVTGDAMPAEAAV